MVNSKIKLVSLILFLDFVVYIFTNLIVFRYSPSQAYSIFALCIRDVIIFLFSVVIYLYFCNSKVSSIVLLPKINNKIIKNSIIIGLAFYFVASGSNLIFTGIFKFTLKSTLYLNGIYDLYNLGIGFILYIIVYSIFIEIFFRAILDDAFKFLSYKSRILITSIIFSLFFFGLSQIFYGFILGILLMSFLNKIGSVVPVIIASASANILNYLVKLFGENVMRSFGDVNSFLKGDLFVDFLFPVIIVLAGLIVYSVFMDKMNIKKVNKIPEEQNSNVIDFNSLKGVKQILNLYFLLFISSTILMLIISYVFLG